MPFYGWIYKGVTKTIKANTGRKRLNLNGALNLEDMDITVLSEKTIDTEAMKRLVLEIEKNNKKEKSIYWQITLHTTIVTSLKIFFLSINVYR